MEFFFNKQEPIFTQNMTGCLFGNITLETISVEVEFKEIIQLFFSDWIEAFRHIFLSDQNDSETAENLSQQSVMEIEGALMMMRVFGKVELLKSACQRILNLFKQ
jgi:TetR/AcrR family transcriptional repressor of nem operon